MRDEDFSKLLAELKKQAGMTIQEVSLINQPEPKKCTENHKRIKTMPCVYAKVSVM